MSRGRVLTLIAVLACVALSCLAWVEVPTVVPEVPMTASGLGDGVVVPEGADPIHPGDSVSIFLTDDSAGWKIIEVRSTCSDPHSCAQVDQPVRALEKDISQERARLVSLLFQQSETIIRLRRLSLAAGGGLVAVILIVAGRRRIGRAAGLTRRLALSTEVVDELASMSHDLRHAPGLTRRQRWRHRYSLPTLWIYAAVRVWTAPLRRWSK